MILIFVILPTIVFGFEDPRCTDSTPRNDLLSCFSQLIDTNHDNFLNATEVNNFNTACCSTWPDTVMNPNDYLQMSCDINRDGMLDMSDWNHRHACCKQSWCIRQVCAFCYANGWTNTTRK